MASRNKFTLQPSPYKRKYNVAIIMATSGTGRWFLSSLLSLCYIYKKSYDSHQACIPLAVCLLGVTLLF